MNALAVNVVIQSSELTRFCVGGSGFVLLYSLLPYSTVLMKSTFGLTVLQR
jgi:hypothetical protein